MLLFTKQPWPKNHRGFESLSVRYIIRRKVAQLGSASALGAEGRRFESCLSDYATLAQLAEQSFCKAQVAGSIPVSSFDRRFYGRYTRCRKR